MTTPNEDTAVLSFFEEILRNAFEESGETSVQEWCDGKSLQDLVHLPIAQKFYKQWAKPEVPDSWRDGNIQSSLGDWINKNPARPSVLVTQEGPWEIRLHRTSSRGDGTRID